MMKKVLFVLLFFSLGKVYAADSVAVPPPPPAEKSVQAPQQLPQPKAPEVVSSVGTDMVMKADQSALDQNDTGMVPPPEQKIEVIQRGNETITVVKDPDGTIIQEIIHTPQSPEGPATITTKTYDENGNLTRQEVKDTEGNIINQTDYTYDSDGRLLHRLTVDANGRPISEETHTYDSEGRPLTYTYWDIGGIRIQESWTYDSQGRETKYTRDGPDGRTESTTVYNPDGSYTVTTGENIKKYDKDGNQIPDPDPAPAGPAQGPVIH